MQLYVDWGNSRIKWCLMPAGNRNINDADLGVQTHHNTSAFNVALDAACCQYGNFDRAWIGATADKHMEITACLHSQQATATLHFAQVQRTWKGLRNGYCQPHQLGIDRWLAMIAGYVEFPRKALLIVDAGSALTLDAVNAQGEHLGGYIVAGAARLAGALHDIPTLAEYAEEERFSEPQKHYSHSHFGQSTAECLDFGLQMMLCAFIERSLDALRTSAKVLLCGGDAPWLQAGLSIPVHHHPHLVLQGLYEYGKRDEFTQFV